LSNVKNNMAVAWSLYLGIGLMAKTDEPLEVDKYENIRVEIIIHMATISVWDAVYKWTVINMATSTMRIIEILQIKYIKKLVCM
jgi:hypothetical protein